MPNVYNQFTRKNRRVKNLGWLLRNSQNADIVWIYPQHNGSAFMRVEMTGALSGDSFCTSFASFEICKKWVMRRALAHCYIEINHPDKPVEILRNRS